MAHATGEAIYIKKWSSWFWVVQRGNGSYFYGPYRSKAEAETKRENVDAK